MSDKDRRSFSELVFQRGKLKVLKELIEGASKKYNVRELSKESGASYDVTYRFVRDLIDIGVVKSRKVGRSRIISLNEKSPYVQKIRELVRIDVEPLKEVAGKYATDIIEEAGARSVVLFGSVAKGTPDMESDLDLLILADSEVEGMEKRANRIASKYEREEGVTIVPVVEHFEEFLEDLELESPFSMEVKKYGEVLEGEKPW